MARTAEAVAESPPLRLLQGGLGRVRSGEAPLRRAPAGTSTAGASTARVSPARLERDGRRDGTRLTLLAAALGVFGLVIVAAASPVISLSSYSSAWSLAERQVIWALLGAVAFVVALRCDVARLRRRARPILVVTAALLAAVLVPHLGKGSGGSSRWLGAGPISIQPSELAKLAFALFAADLVARRQRAQDQLHQLVLPLAIVVSFLGVLILKQPDLGTAVVVVAIAAVVWWLGGVRGRLLAGIVVVLAALGGILALAAPYRRARLLTFLDPFGHASTAGYQLVQSLSALGSGHLTGVAASSSVAAWFLPNASSDFVFAAVGNDFGLVGCLAVLAAFAAFGYLGARVAARAEDRFAALLAGAITCWVVFQAVVNVGGVVGLLPDTGIPLPFLSSGGSALIVVLAASGLLVNLARHPRLDTETVRPRRRSRPAPRRAAPPRATPRRAAPRRATPR